MRDRSSPTPSHAASPAPDRSPRPAPRTSALQRAIGNRALARWARHPDPEQKGVMVNDSVAAELERLNPPQNT